MNTIGSVVLAFFADHLPIQRGFLPASVQSYRDTIKLFLCHIADEKRCPITKLTLSDVTCDRVLAFLRDIEVKRNNTVSTRNQRLAALRIFFRYLANQCPETLAQAQRVEAIPTKRKKATETVYLERDEVDTLFNALPREGALAHRDRCIFMLLYNTGARAQEVVSLNVDDVTFTPPYKVKLHGKGDKWRTCPLWAETATLLSQLGTVINGTDNTPLFLSKTGLRLTRFGLYKLVSRHCANILEYTITGRERHVTPHVFRHTTAVHLLEAGVDMNVIRGWLGHVSLDTTQRYAEINLKMKQEALATCLPPVESAVASPSTVRWRQDKELMNWLNSL